MSIATDRLDEMDANDPDRNSPQVAGCTCDFGPDSDGPDQGCPEHGDVRWYSSWFRTANADRTDAVKALRAVLAEADRLDTDAATQLRVADGLEHTDANLGTYKAANRHSSVARAAAERLRTALDTALADH